MSFLDLTLSSRGHAPFSLHLRARLAVWRSRRDLARLDARALDDIGVTAEDAAREASLSLWDVPATWKQD